MLRRARLTVAYDGTSFHGFAENDGVRTVMGELREAIEKMLQQPVDLVGAVAPMPVCTDGDRWSVATSPTRST